MKKYLFLVLFLLVVMMGVPFLAGRKAIVGYNAVDAASSESIATTPSTAPSETAPPSTEVQASDAPTDAPAKESETGEEKPADIFKVLNNDSGEITEISALDYIIGCVAGEIPISFHEEAIKAQAVAAYTYADRQRQSERKNPTEALKGADISNNSAKDQSFLTVDEMKTKWGSNFDTYYEKLSSAVTAVIGQKIVYEDEPILAAYHALSPGVTESSANVWGGDLPYLTAVESAGDISADGFESEVTITADELKSKVLDKYPETTFEGDSSGWVSGAVTTESGTVTSIKIGSKTMTGAVVRNLFGLRSACFEVSFTDGSFIFFVKGYGHAVGLSQTGANYMAKNGAVYTEILTHYYQGTQIV